MKKPEPRETRSSEPTKAELKTQTRNRFNTPLQASNTKDNSLKKNLRNPKLNSGF